MSLQNALGDTSGHGAAATLPLSEGVETALARALERASAAGRWDVVAQLARELDARRLAAAGVTDLADERARRDSKR